MRTDFQIAERFYSLINLLAAIRFWGIRIVFALMLGWIIGYQIVEWIR